jgi:hypothetical protein
VLRFLLGFQGREMDPPAVLFHDAHLVIDARCPRVAFDEVQGAHNGLVHAITRAHVQHVEKPRDHAPVVVSIGGAHPQVHLLLVAALGLILLDNGFALLLADGGKDAGANGLFGMSKRGVGHPVQDRWGYWETGRAWHD